MKGELSFVDEQFKIVLYKPNKEKIINTSHQYYSLEQGVKRYKEVYREILGV